jgi:hypothetical protein
MNTLIILAATLLISIGTKASDSLFIWTESRPLQWNDFSRHLNDNSQFDAEVFAEVRYKYTFSAITDFKFEVVAVFNKNTSWSRISRQTEDLLKHEQLHFDIAELYARKLKAEFEKYNYTENFEQEVQEIFNTLKNEYRLMQLKCDEDTNHSLNKEKQLEWEAFIFNELLKMKSLLAKV